jgi:hypothetical protein
MAHPKNKLTQKSYQWIFKMHPIGILRGELSCFLFRGIYDTNLEFYVGMQSLSFGGAGLDQGMSGLGFFEFSNFKFV